MAERQSKEARKLIQRLLKQIADEGSLSPEQKKNQLKANRRALGTLLFSPDYIGHIDRIEQGLTKGESANTILKSIAGKSEKIVKGYSFNPGVFEAHHVIPLSALRDNFMQLSSAEQDKFLDMLADSGWELGDSPQQLLSTVQSRPAHIKQDPIRGLGAESWKGQSADLAGQVTSHGTPGGSVPTNNPALMSKGATTADELMDNFQMIAKVSQEQAIRGNFTDEGVKKAVLEASGGRINLYNVNPEAVYDLSQSEEGIQLVRQANQAGAEAGVVRNTLETNTARIQQLAPDVLNPNAAPVPDAVAGANRQLQRFLQSPGGQQTARLLGRLNDIPGTAAIPILGGGLMAAGALGDAAQASEGVSNMNQAQSPRQYAKGALQTLGAGAGLMGIKSMNPALAAGGGIASGLAGIMDWVDQQQVQRTRRTNLETGLGNSTAYTVGSNKPDEEYKPPELVPTVQPRLTPNRYERRNR